MSKADDADDGASIEAVAEAIDGLSDEERHELHALSDTLGESGGGLSEDLQAAIKADEDVQREIRNLVEPSSSRRDALKGVAAGGLAGLIGGAGSAAADVDVNQSGSLDVGSVTTNTYRIAGNRFGGPASARSELASELGSGDAGARYAADDTGGEYYWTGSGWDLLPVTTDSLPSNRENALDWNPPFNEWEAVSAIPAPSPEFGTWTKNSNNPVLEGSDLNFTPNAEASHASLFRIGDTYHILFTGVKSDSTVFKIGHATSTDLVNWSMDPDNPVLTPSSSGWDDGRVYQPELVRVGDTYYLFYTGDSGNTNADNAEIGVATADATLSDPFANFSKSSNNPILTAGPTIAWDSQQVQEPAVFFDGGQYIMAYRGDGNGEQMGIAFATDPTASFTKSSYNPVKSTGNVNNNGTTADHELLKIGGRYHLFYVSDDANGDDNIFHAYSGEGNLTTWTDHRNNPIIDTSSSGWDDADTRAPTVLREPHRYVMLYDGIDSGGGRAIGLATFSVPEVN